MPYKNWNGEYDKIGLNNFISAAVELYNNDDLESLSCKMFDYFNLVSASQQDQCIELLEEYWKTILETA